MTQHVLKLLLDNALKYSPPGTPITISSSVDGGTIDIGVSDAGPGVPEDELARIFEKHYRGSTTVPASPGRGSGSRAPGIWWSGRAARFGSTTGRKAGRRFISPYR